MPRGENPENSRGCLGDSSTRSSRDDTSSRESGAVLILALIYIVVVSLVVAALSGLAINDLNNTPKFAAVTELHSAATNMTEVAIQYVRYNPQITSATPSGVASPLVSCWGGNSLSQLPTFDTYQMAVWCSTIWNPLSAQTRKVTFYTCQSNLLAAQCASSPLLQTLVTFDDYPVPPKVSAPNQTICTVLCGQGMTLTSWIWGGTASGSVSGVATTVTFNNEPSDVIVGSTTSAAVTVIDANNNPVAGDTVSITVQSGPGPLDASSTLSAITNTSGVASFSNLLPDLAGNYVLLAADGSVTQSSTNFVVSKLANSLSNVSNAPSLGTVGGANYTPSATATSGDAVAIALDASSTGCTISGGVVSFTATGTCLVDFNDPGNTTYAAAPQIQQSIPVSAIVRGSYTGSSSGNLPSGGAYYYINQLNSSGSTNTETANAIKPGVATTLTSLTLTTNSTSPSNQSARVGLITSGTWSATSLTCTVPGNSGSTSCTITLNVSIPAGSSINVFGSGNNYHTGTWTVTYTQP